MKYQNQNTSLAYHLAEALKAYIYSSPRRLDMRTDLLGFAGGTVASMLKWKTKDEETTQTLAEINESLLFLEKNYEQVMDELPYLAEKRAAYRTEQRLTMNKILDLIRDENLLSNSVMREIYANKWGDTRRRDANDE